jgi:hypothetical protein
LQLETAEMQRWHADRVSPFLSVAAAQKKRNNSLVDLSACKQIGKKISGLACKLAGKPGNGW